MAERRDPMMMDVPAELKSSRLTMRAPRFGDGERVWRTVQASLAEVKVWMPWATDAYGPKDAELWCRRSAIRFLTREELAYLLFLGPEHVGNLSLFRFDWQVPCGEIGYWLATARCGQGLMTEAVRALAGMAFGVLGMERLEIRCDSRNERSCRVAERCGFQLEGVLRRQSRDTGGALRDTHVYARLRPA